MAEEETAILDAFTRIREAAEEYMDDRDSLGHGWDEETVTGVSTHKGAPQVQVIYFTKQQQEPVVGADYLWWFLDRESSACFGMLVQAKRLKRPSDRWTVDIRHGDSVDGAVVPQGRQYADLLRTAEQLNVPAMYAVYAGGLVFRDGLPCFHESDPAGCEGCRRMAISMISAYQLSAVVAPADTAGLIFEESIPLENLVDPAVPAGPVRDLNLPTIPEGPLREFLLEDQVGPD